MSCMHENYNAYFDQCTDCKLDGFSIHEATYLDHHMMAVDDSGSYECHDCDYEGCKVA